ncbi:MAG: N-6 DNA methylase [Caldisericaceae bacterium]|nr:N-6 DNA methylase [Caldisericaceae bacterium]
MLKKYLEEIYKTYAKGDAREESYYSALSNLLKSYANSVKKSNVEITTLPKKTEAGNPDFRVWDGAQHIIGYIEAKAPEVINLDKIQASEQLRRYINTFPNVMLTNFFEFRLYRNGKLIDDVTIGVRDTMVRLGKVPPAKNEQKFKNLLAKFFSFSLPKSYTAETLADELAKKTRFLRDEVIKEEIEEETKGKEGSLIGFYEAFKKYLINDLKIGGFVDLFSQTIVYGLFSARMRAGENFDRVHAYESIPETIGILKDLFKFISLGDVPEQMKWIIDDIADVLSVADVNSIFSKYYSEGKGKDPVVYFYETFLSVYNPDLREKRGVYYTPEPVVKYIVNSLDEILKSKMGISGGLSDGKVTVLDPAAGTLSFITEAVQLAVKEFTERFGTGGKQKFIKEHILRDFYAFELMMAPYAIGHIKFSFILEEEGYKLNKDERPKFYLTNTLEMKTLEKTNLPLMSALSEESHLAEKVKKDTPILVIMGNPPYSGSSANNGEWISKTIKEYYQIEGKPLKEKNPKWLQDDYVKFIRFAQWKIEQSGEGIIGFITNHSYLDNPTFRGMRYSLLKSFDEIYILNLHGNSLKKEKCPDGGKDENVFDIRQGVAIAFFIKRKDFKGDKKVFYADLFGLRKEKYEYLLNNTIKTTEWAEISPHKEFFFFVPRDERGLETYETFRKITDIFPLNGVGMTTARDKFVIDFDKQALLNRIRLFKNSSDYSDDELHEIFGINKKKGWSIRKAVQTLESIPDNELEKYIFPVLYRPFDKRWIFYHDAIVWRTVKRIMQHMMKENLGLITVRQVAEGVFNHAFISNSIIESRITLSNKGIAYLFPLYLYPSSDNDLHLPPLSEEKPASEDKDDRDKKVPNLKAELIKQLNETYKTDVTPEEIFYYIYAVLYSNIYREKYAEFLKINLPRVPFTADYGIFKEMAQYGKELVNLHLLRSDKLNTPVAKFQGGGNGFVEKVKYDESKERVYINKNNYFENVPKDVWEYQIGGYQVCDKWLKSRKGRKLLLDEIERYCKITTAIKETILFQKQIDSIYPELEKSVIS